MAKLKKKDTMLDKALWAVMLVYIQTLAKKMVEIDSESDEKYKRQLSMVFTVIVAFARQKALSTSVCFPSVKKQLPPGDCKTRSEPASKSIEKGKDAFSA